MNWIYIAISSHFFWALANIGDKYVVGNRIKNPYVYLIWLSIVELLIIIALPFINLAIPSLEIFLWLLLASTIFFLASLPYIKAIKIEEISRINIWWQLIPIFSFGIAWLFLDEKLGVNQLIAMAILVIGGALGSIHAKKRGIAFSKAFFLMMLSCLLYSIYAVVLHYVTEFIPVIDAFIWVVIISSVVTFVLLLSKKNAISFREEFKNIWGKKLLLFIAIIGAMNCLGMIANIWALSLGPVALVYSMEGWQVLFVFIIASLISTFNPKAIKEELDLKNILLKVAALILMVVGVVMINLS